MFIVKSMIYTLTQKNNIFKFIDMKVKFYNKNGDLSLYSFCCGYVQKEEKENIKKELFMEHATFHVKVYSVSDVSVATVSWDSFYSLTDARKAYKLYKI